MPPTVHSLFTCNMVHFPSEVADQLCPTGPSTATSCSSPGFNNEQINTQVAAYLQPEVVSSVATSSTNSALDPTYTALLSEHLDPTAVPMDIPGSRYYDDDCSYNYDTVLSCGSDNQLGATAVAALLALILLCLYVNVLDACFPVIFFFGLLENYFWFHQMVHGKFSLRLGTALWIFLLPPTLCLTRRCPARDPQTQKALQQQWKTVSFDRAMWLWLRWGFCHRYPAALLRPHPLYRNPAPGSVPLLEPLGIRSIPSVLAILSAMAWPVVMAYLFQSS